MQNLIHNIVYSCSYFKLFWLSLGYFLVLYFAVAPMFLMVCKFLASRKFLNKIQLQDASKKQIYFEIRYSFQSIVVFGFSIIPVIYLIRHGVVILLPNTFFNVALGAFILTIWNEVHFFIIHRIMHLPFFMKKVHYIHHKSKIPTVYSVYSFHWFEAFLLSTVPLSIVPFIPFSVLAIFIYPFISILLNYAGHCNYRFSNGIGNSWKLFGTHHNEHHFKGKKNYGFVLNFFDKILTSFNQSK